jgi:hypothetical protein
MMYKYYLPYCHMSAWHLNIVCVNHSLLFKKIMFKHSFELSWTANKVRLLYYIFLCYLHLGTLFHRSMPLILLGLCSPLHLFPWVCVAQCIVCWLWFDIFLFVSVASTVLILANNSMAYVYFMTTYQIQPNSEVIITWN